jgi:hypothetical protein
MKFNTAQTFTNTNAGTASVSIQGLVSKISITRGNSVYTTPGSYSFIVPAGVTQISAVAVGGGGGGNYAWSNSGGGGGALAWANNIPVNPGQVIPVVVGAGGVGGSTGGNGGPSSVGSFFSAQGGYGSASGLSGTAAVPLSGTVTAYGGNGGRTQINGYGGGAGAGGYTGPGGDGMYGNATGRTSTAQNPADGTGKGGGANGGDGYASSSYGFGGGGGVGLFGIGASGSQVGGHSTGITPILNSNQTFSQGQSNANWQLFTYGGAPGSGGEWGASNHNTSYTEYGRTRYHGEGGRCGGGGGGGGDNGTPYVTADPTFCYGGAGGVNIIYALAGGVTPTFPLGV